MKNLPLAALAVISAAPFVAAWLLASTGALPAGAHHGELIAPPRPLAEVSVSGEPAIPPVRYRGRWLLLMLDDRCGSACVRRFDELRRIGRALGEQRARTARLLVVAHPLPAPVAAMGGTDGAGLRLASGPYSALQAWFGEVGPVTATVHLIDPWGRWMMRYPPEVPAKDILADLQRLLKVSKYWESNDVSS